MKKSPLSDILKTLMFKKNIKTSGLARDLDLPQQTLQRIVSGTSPNPHQKTLKPIAEFFEVSVEQLKGDQPLPEDATEINLPTTKPKAKQIPILNWDDIEMYLQNPDDSMAAEHVFVDQLSSDQVFALSMNDSSMEPYFPKGSTLIIDPEKPANDRSFVIVKIAESDTYIFRQLLIDGEISYLKPLNPDLNTFQMRLLKKQDKILGALIEFRHRYENL